MKKCKKSKNFTSLLERIGKELNHPKNNLDSLLALPLDKIYDYETFFELINNNTPTHEADFQNCDALQKVKEISEFVDRYNFGVNPIVDRVKNVAHLIRIREQLIGLPIEVKHGSCVNCSRDQSATFILSKKEN